MWLINVSTLKLEHFVDLRTGNNSIKYAILSHTWGQDEVTFQDMQNLNVARRKVGFKKIEKTCQEARLGGYQYAWVDTCCIDKTSSAELQEAINSMYKWYGGSSTCYAYLEDVDSDVRTVGGTATIVESRWWTRGWTLQELIAPHDLRFYSKDWEFLGTKSDYKDHISESTGIPVAALLPVDDRGRLRNLRDHSVAERMFWAALRETTRIEDQAYCLIGLFDVALPMLYGEGAKSFTRLQEEILRVEPDLSLLLWEFDEHWQSPEKYDLQSLFAPSPRCFKSCGNIMVDSHNVRDQIRGGAAERIVGAVGLKTSLPIIPVDRTNNKKFGALLSCFDRSDPTITIALRLTERSSQRLRPDLQLLYPAYIPADGEVLRLAAYCHEDWQKRAKIRLIWNTTVTRTVAVDAIEAEHLSKTSLKPIVLAREQTLEEMDVAPRVRPIFGGNFWLRCCNARMGAFWSSASLYPARGWNIAKLTLSIDEQGFSAMENCVFWKHDGKDDSIHMLTCAMSLTKQGTNGGQSCMAVISCAWPVVEIGRKWPKIYFRVDANGPLNGIMDENELSTRCRQLIAEDIPAEPKEMWHDKKWTNAKGALLQDGSTVFAAKPEIKLIAGRYIAVLHVFELDDLEQVPRLDEETQLPLYQRGRWVGPLNDRSSRGKRRERVLVDKRSKMKDERKVLEWAGRTVQDVHL